MRHDQMLRYLYFLSRETFKERLMLLNFVEIECNFEFAAAYLILHNLGVAKSHR